MNSISQIAQRFLLSIIALTVMASTLLAKDSAAPAEPEGPKGYILQYTLIALASFLGVFVACRPGKRQKETKLQKALEDDQ